MATMGNARARTESKATSESAHPVDFPQRSAGRGREEGMASICIARPAIYFPLSRGTNVRTQRSEALKLFHRVSCQENLQTKTNPRRWAFRPEVFPAWPLTPLFEKTLRGEEAPIKIEEKSVTIDALGGTWRPMLWQAYIVVGTVKKKIFDRFCIKCQ